MQQYNVPQFVEVEDKIIGPLTLRQFLVLVFGAAIIFAYYAIFQYSLVFWFLAVPTGLIILFVALASINGRPVFSYVFPLVSFVGKPKQMLFHREANPIIIQTQKTENKDAAVGPADVQSRLKRLSYILDQKAQAEEQIAKSQTPMSNDQSNLNS